MDFNAGGMKYLDYDIKTSMRSHKTYYIYIFQDMKSKREYVVYDWHLCPLHSQLVKNQVYAVSGIVNVLNHTPFLVIKSVEVEK